MKFRILIADDQGRDEVFAFFRARCERELEELGHEVDFDIFTAWNEIFDPSRAGLQKAFYDSLCKSHLILLDLSFPEWYDEPSFGIFLLKQLDGMNQHSIETGASSQIPPVVILSGAMDTDEDLGDLPHTSILIDVFSKNRVLRKEMNTFAARWEFSRMMLLLGRLDQNQIIERQDRQIKRQTNKIEELEGKYTLIDGGEIDENLDRYAKSELPVLITGPTGAGKEVLAREYHERSSRIKKEFVAVNCGAVPPDLFESLFFGIRKGAATGVTQDQPGYIQKSDKGTLFLDEIGDLLPIHQVKLLRVLQDQTFFWVGDNTETQVDFRLISATNIDLLQRIQEGKFRSDLYFRIVRLDIQVPPFYQRPDKEKKKILKKILNTHKSKYEKGNLRYSTQLHDQFMHKPVEGNLRVIDGMVEVAVALFPEKTGEIDFEHLPKGLQVNLESPVQGTNYTPLFTDSAFWTHPIWTTKIFSHEKKAKPEGSIGSLRIKAFDALKRLELFLDLKTPEQTVADFATMIELTSQTVTNPIDQYLLRLVHILPEKHNALKEEIISKLKTFLGHRSYQTRAQIVKSASEYLGG
jgi:DNA-binding NtrC family response regulator